MRIIISGEVKNNKLKLDDRSYFDKIITSFDNKRVNLYIEEYKKQRSDNQNRYYWGVVIKILSDELGYTPEETHEALKIKFLRIKGEKLDTVKSTTKLSTKEAEDFYEEIRRWASVELSIDIPEPNEVNFTEND